MCCTLMQAEGLGDVLYQDQEDGLRPIAFVSRSLTPAEKNYPTHKLEFLVLKWALTRKMHDYLCGAKFEVHAHNSLLTYVLTTAKLDTAGHRWLAELSTYDFHLKYHPGKQNTDALSRRNCVVGDEEEKCFPTSTVKAVCRMISVGPYHHKLRRVIDILGPSKQTVLRAYCNLPSLSTHWLPKMTTAHISCS